ncbi:MAG: endopeptidase La [Victivallales bacterium]|nr:endopeptidase La [Victivallales bacterium]
MQDGDKSDSTVDEAAANEPGSAVGVSSDAKGLPDIKRVFEAPLLPIHDVIIFPYTLSPLAIESPEVISMVEDAIAGDKLVCIFPAVPPAPVGGKEALDTQFGEFESFDSGGKPLSRAGTACRIVKKLRFPDDTVRILVRGLKRINALAVKNVPPAVPLVLYEDLLTVTEDDIEVSALAQSVMKLFQEIVSISPVIPEELKIAVLNVNDNARMVDLVVDALNTSFSERLRLLAIPVLKERMRLLVILLSRELEVLKVGTEIQMQVSSTLGQTQREMFLREQLKAIKKELGEGNKNPDIVAIEKTMSETDLPEHVMELLKKELDRLSMIPQAAAEYNVAHTYIDWILSVPWKVFTEDTLDISKARRVLDSDHYDLVKVKERILEFLAVLQLKKDRKSPIICFVGPPGVGKTSLGQSIARAMDRRFVRMSLGGIRDEAEIRGHRRTYVGALPGRIIQGLKKAKSGNPVFMLDEIDKIGNDFRGDPAAALLEVLDPQQNNSFNDHYLELDYDLSSVMFIATANITDTIPPALLDRMELIRLPGYTSSEKRHIARRFLIPRQLKENGLKQRQLFFPSATIDEMISMYTREAGVRKLERTIGTVCRKTARKIVEKQVVPKSRTVLRPGVLKEYLGPRKYLRDEASSKPEVGSAVGMAWTSVGGTILNVEVTTMKGKGVLQLTGSLGDVMKESAQTACSLVRSRARCLRIKSEFFSAHDIHIHVPDGATPKDGPSAGIAIFIALASHLTGRAVRPLCSMTGEITLRGKVTEVGGIKEKVIAALSAGIKDIVLPDDNAKDLQDIPEEVKRRLKFHFVKDVSEAVSFLLAKK